MSEMHMEKQGENNESSAIYLREEIFVLILAFDDRHSMNINLSVIFFFNFLMTTNEFC